VDRHVHQAKVINGERGEKVRGDNQPIDWSRAEFVDEREPGENRDRTSKPGEWCPSIGNVK
jgi:hypothetical protein